MPQQPTIRRAQPLDVVNLYRLVSAQGEFDLLDHSDEARALVQVLEAIRDGYVLVAETKARRIVATVGFVGDVLPSRGTVCKGIFGAVIPSFRDTPLVAELLDLTVRAIQAKLPVHIPRPLPGKGAFRREVIAAGFTRGAKSWIKDKKNKNAVAPPTNHQSVPGPA